MAKIKMVSVYDATCEVQGGVAHIELGAEGRVHVEIDGQTLCVKHGEKNSIKTVADNNSYRTDMEVRRGHAMQGQVNGLKYKITAAPDANISDDEFDKEYYDDAHLVKSPPWWARWYAWMW